MTKEEHTPSFADFKLDPRCLEVLKKNGIITPSPVQAQAIPAALDGKDVVVTAQTGTGKTLAFALPALTRLARQKTRANRMLVLAPVRELCIQVELVISEMCKALKLHSAPVYGGVGMRPQTDRIARGCDIIVATPGRLLDHIGRGAFDFRPLEILVFDEADRMLDMGFLPDIRRILKVLPRKRQTMMFSATFQTVLDRLTQEMMHEPQRITVGRLSKPVATLRQAVIPVREDEKLGLLLELLKEEDMDATLVFLRTIRRTDRIAKQIKRAGFKATAIHGDLPQSQRQRALDGFRNGKFNILVATDVAARGLDISEISHVVNYDIPVNPDDYVHRIGRTARAERVGDAITLVTPQDHSALGAIENALGYNIERRKREGAPKILSIFTPPGKRTAQAGPGRRRGRSLLKRR